MKEKKIKPSNGGVKLTASIPSSSDFDGNFEFSTRHDNDEVEITLTKDEKTISFSVKKLDFLLALDCIFPHTISPQALHILKTTSKVTPSKMKAPKSNNNISEGIENIFREIFGGDSKMNFKIIDGGEFPFPPPMTNPEDEEQKDD